MTSSGLLSKNGMDLGFNEGECWALEFQRRQTGDEGHQRHTSLLRVSEKDEHPLIQG